MGYLQRMEKEMSEEFRDFNEAREFVRKLGLKNRREWREYNKSGEIPDYIPKYPEGVYKNKGWIGMGDWLGTGTISVKDMQFRSFESARKFAQKLGLKSRLNWDKFCKSGDKPDDIPVVPRGIYKKEWKGWGDWLSTRNIAPKDKVYRSFTESRKFAQKLQFTSILKWNEYCTSGNKPHDIPSSPQKVYKKEWDSWPEFLGNKNIASQKRKYLPFIEAREFVRKLKLKNSDDWKEYSKSDKRPVNIPGAPNEVYKNKGWSGIPDWLGNDNVSNINRKYLTYGQCSKFVQKNNITTRKQWEKFCKSGNKPSDIPGHPWDVYQKQGTWIDWGEFTNTGIVANQNKVYRSFTEAKEFVQKLGLKNQQEWFEYCKSGNKPDDIPTAPWKTYKEWKKK
jgi:hypothetical protein